MTPYPNCAKAKVWAGYRLFDPACLYCGARIIQHLGTLMITTSECSQRRRENLADWVAMGHDEAQIRTLAKGKFCIGPEVDAVSEPPKLEKPAVRGKK